MLIPHLRDPVEILYLALMLRWERTAPPDGSQVFPDGSHALLDGTPERNTQMSRFAYVLKKVAVGNETRVYAHLARHTRRNDGQSYISTDPSWMQAPRPLSGGWYFEGCTSLPQKQAFLSELTGLGQSPTFAACAADFVAGNSVRGYVPTDAEQDDILRQLDAVEEGEGSVGDKPDDVSQR